MKVILISATGQVGYALAPALMEAGHEVTVLVRDASRLPFSKSIRRVAVPEFDAEVFGRALRDVECAVYCVGLPEQFAFDTCVFDRVNRGLLTTFLSALEASAVRRLVYISTFEVFSPRHGVIRESHPMTPLAGLSPYFTAMTLAYQDVMEFASRTQTRLTTIHPAAVYCGLNTGDGFTGVIENLLNWRVWRLPAVPPGRFPLVHAGSLAEGVASALLYQGPFILSDEMCDLPTLARALRSQVRSYVPLTVPASLAYGAARPIEALGRAIHRRPLLSRVQLDFIASSSEPLADRARETFGFTPLPIEKGLSVICRNAHACWPRSLTARRPRRRRQPRTRAHSQPGHCGEAVAMNPTRLVHLGSGPKRHQLEVRRWLRRKHVLHIRLSAVDA